MNYFIIQDTIRQNKPARQDTTKQLSDSLARNFSIQRDSSQKTKTVSFHPAIKTEPSDTNSLCFRNSIADVTFYDSANIVTLIDERNLQNFPFVFTESVRKTEKETRAELVRHLKNGEELSADRFHYGWGLLLILFSLFIYGVINAETRSFFKGTIRFLTFRGINETASRDIANLFQWQSTLLNLASFINISLFAFFTATWFDILPESGNPAVYWLISFAIILSAVTARHLVCIITGNLSGEEDMFGEYLIGIYQMYRLTGLILFLITVFILYATFIPVNILYYSGFSMVALLYFIRVFRLFLIFINRHVSIFYLILYLCALEILPVVILVKYVTGLA
jgi:hypothetical protein